MQFPFPSLRYPTAHEIWAEQRSEHGIHPPFPSVVNPDGQLGVDYTETGVSAVGKTGTQPPYPSVSHPLAHEIDETTEIATQFPLPSLVYPDGQT